MTDKITKWEPITLAQTNKTFCILPWIHQYVGPPGDVKPCCMYYYTDKIGDLKENTLAEIWNNDTTRQLRLDMLNGVVRNECRACNSRDDLNVAPKRFFNKDYFYSRPDLQEMVGRTGEDGTVEEHKLLLMDVRFNNLCNFRCRTCSPHFSSSLITDHRKLYNKPVTEIRDNSFQFPGKTEIQAFDEMVPHFPHMEEVYFAGGEPLLQKEHYMTLEKLLECGNTGLKVRYSTNFSKLKLQDWDAVELWKKFTNVELHASLDANYERAEYWRKGTIWSETVANRKRVLEECPHVRFKIGGTVSWPNAINICDFHKEWVETGLTKIDDIFINFLDGPSYFSLKNIPDWKKKQLETRFREHLVWLKEQNADYYTTLIFESAIGFMYSEDNKDEFTFPAEKFHWVVSRLDHMYQKDYFFDVFPEHADMKKYMEDMGYQFGSDVFPTHSINFDPPKK